MKNTEHYFTKVLPKEFESYENRKEQIQMAARIEKALSDSEHILVEAGTGTGKSIAYLIPSIIHCIINEKRLVVSTYTKVLQSQLVEKDIPLVQKMLKADGFDFKYSVFFGGENYLCLRKYEKYSSDMFKGDEKAERFARWVAATESGILNEYDFDDDWGIMSEVCRESDICLGRKCHFRGRCFYEKALAKAKSSDVVVINHHLLFTNIASGGRLLPNYDVVVCDEAHNLEEVAMDLLGLQVSNFQIKRLADDIFNPRYRKGLLYRLKKVPGHLKDEIVKKIAELKASAGEFFADLSMIVPAGKDTMRFKSPPNLRREIVTDLKELSQLLGKLTDSAGSDEEILEIKSKQKRCLGSASGIDAWLSHKSADCVYWLEKDNLKRGYRITLTITPVDVSGIISEKLFDAVDTAILTSATLSVNDNFRYIASTLGVKNHSELLLASSFDYEKNVILYVPSDIPDPKIAPDSFERRVREEIENIVGLTGGRAFVLFTSYKMLNSVHSELEELKKHNLLKQGASSNYRIIEKFKTSENAVLFGTDTFWQGVDVPGEALICVIITRLPFDVPDHPVVEAKIEKLLSEGKDPFVEYSLPKAILKFRQGFGRLMRKNTDWGVVAVLDPRLKTRFYGRFFLNSIPKTAVTSKMSDVENFIAKKS